MKIVLITRYFKSVPESDTVIMDIDRCTTREELIFRNEIEKCISENKDSISNPTEETLNIIVGENTNSFRKLNFLNNMEPYSINNNGSNSNNTIQYGPTIYI